MSTIFADNFKNTSGGDPVNINEVKTDKITGKTTAGSILVTSEGGSTAANLQQGLTKAWLKTTTASAISDSFNVTSINDVATGQEQVTFTSAFGNTTYVATGTSSENAYHNVVSNWNETVTTTLTRFGSLNVNAGSYQDTVLNCQVNGDLA
tara:strand:- start:384 stop:836 length:453 start_codon:yes stop_codon:yes gene_type:complete